MSQLRKINFLLLGLSLTVALFSCNPEEENPLQINKKVKEAIFESMQEWYYWNEEVPTNIDINNYNSNDQLLLSLMYRQLDRWSYLTNREAFNRAFTGQNAGHGFGFGIGPDDGIYISFVYENAPAGKDGWKRGWEIIGINDKPISSYKVGNGYNFQLGPNEPGITNTFTFRLPDGSTTTRTSTKADYQANSVLFKEVIDTGQKKIGYWVYNSFKATSGVTPTKSVEVDDAIAFFEEQGIKELILDLRYNGGGSVNVAEQIMNYLVPRGNSGKLMYTNALNGDKANFNEEYNFEKKGQLELDKIVFITSRGSASASELIINCLEPYIDVVLIGEQTYGKPVGSFPLSQFNRTLAENDVELVPVTFAIANANGQADYYDGFPVDFIAADDPTRDWGDPDEIRYKAALDFLMYGSVGPNARQLYRDHGWAMIDNFEGLEKEFPVY